MRKQVRNLILMAVASTFILAGCGSEPTQTGSNGDPMQKVKIGVVGEYNAQWATIGDILEEDNIAIELVKFSDYATPNRALDDGEIHMNAFQTQVYLDNEVETKGYDLVSIGDTIIAPLGIFNNKNKIESLSDLKDGDIIAIPNDLINGGRALKVLESAGLIEVDPSKGYIPTKADITNYKVKIELLEAESATLANILPDCAAAVINGGNAITAGLNPMEDTIFIENVDPAVNDNVENIKNVLAVKTEDKENETYQKIVEAYQTEAVEETILETYRGGFLTAW